MTSGFAHGVRCPSEHSSTSLRGGERAAVFGSHSEVQAWVAKMAGKSAPATVRKVHRVLSLVLASAVKDGRLVRSPAEGISVPRVVTTERR